MVIETTTNRESPSPGSRGFCCSLVVALRDRAAALRLGLEVRAAEGRTLRRAAAASGLKLTPVALLWAIHSEERMHDALPADYSYALGPERPFAPSLAVPGKMKRRFILAREPRCPMTAVMTPAAARPAPPGERSRDRG